MQRRHVGDLFAHQAEVGDHFAESLALLGVADGVFQRNARAAHAHGAQLEAADVQNVEGDDVALADFAEQVFHRHLAIVQNQRAGGRAANAHLVLFGADGESGKVPLDQKCGELFAVDLGEDGEQVGEAGVGDPHLFAVEDVVLAVGRKLGAGAAIQGVGAGRGFREGIGADDLAGGQPRQILLLLLFGAEVNDGQRADAAVRAPGGGEAGVLGDVVGDDGGGDLVHFQAAVGFGDLDAAQAEFAGLLQQIARDGEILVLDLLGVGQDLVDGELFRRLRDELVLLGEIFGREDFVRTGAPRGGSCRRRFWSWELQCVAIKPPLNHRDLQRITEEHT